MSIRGKHIIILTHVLTTVPAEDLEQFLLSHDVEQLLVIGHPLYFLPNRPGPTLTYFKKKQQVKKIVYKNRKYPILIQYVKDVVLSMIWILRFGKKWDCIVAVDNLNALTGLFLKRIGIVKKVVYYTIDFVPERFPNKLLNLFYHRLDIFCVRHADITWNVSPRFIEGRGTIVKQSADMRAKQVTVPIGVWLDKNVESQKDSKKPVLMYAGGLLPHQGVQLVLQSLPKIRKKFPDIVLKIIGIGTYEKELKKLTKQLHIEKSVQFLGYFESHDAVMAEIRKATVGLALYNKRLDQWSSYADPSKIKAYLAGGLPVITTDVTHIAKDIEKAECGIVVPYDTNALATTIISLLQDKQRLHRLHKHALQFIKVHDWNVIFMNGFKQIL